MRKYVILPMLMLLTACSTAKFPSFSSQHWHVDEYSGNAVSDLGMELGFGSEWMVQDTFLIQSSKQLMEYPELEKHLAKGLAEFPEIAVDSILFYNPARGLLFATYHQIKPLKPTTELWLYHDSVPAYSKEHAELFGVVSTYIDEVGWEKGPSNSVYTNVSYRPGKKQMVLLQRIPYRGQNLAIFQICRTKPKRGNWWPSYPIYPYWAIDLGNPDNIEYLSMFLQSARTTAVSNLKLGTQKK